MGGDNRGLRIDIGCAEKRHEDCNIGLDKHDFSEFYEEGGFIQHDILEPLPFDDCSADWIYCHHVLEHLPHRLARTHLHLVDDDEVATFKYDEIDTLVFVINEFHRVLKVGAEAFIVVPWIEHTNAWRHPTHYRFFNHETFVWFEHGYPGGDHEAEGLEGKWKLRRNEIVDDCHVVAVLRKVE